MTGDFKLIGLYVLQRDTEIARLKNALADSERLNKIQAENERLLQTQLVEARSTSSSNLLSTRQESRSWQEKEEQTRAERDDAQTALEALREEREEERLWKVELVASIVILYKELGNRLKAEESWREEAERRADELEGMLEIERRATVIAQEDLGDQHRQLEVYQTLLDDAYESINNLLDDHQSLRVLLDDQAQSSASNESSSLSSTSPLPQDNDPCPSFPPSRPSSTLHTSLPNSNPFNPPSISRNHMLTTSPPASLPFKQFLPKHPPILSQQSPLVKPLKRPNATQKERWLLSSPKETAGTTSY
jgi:hypothetical protein